jgi:DNA-binding transcriptional regulator YiaG
MPKLVRQVQNVLADPTLRDAAAIRLALHRAIDESLADAGLYTRGAAAVARLGRLFGMSHEELGRMFRVSGETVRRWERGQVRIPDARQAELETMAAAADRLEALFVADRLPQVIRRPAELFGGETALAWIERGRIADVADRYETALAYQQ